ncbi:hypothetical protein Vafri_15106 [Volvox africanus]|nr:hypothetical protein Vafri_15106 [Volvox africanus]
MEVLHLFEGRLSPESGPEAVCATAGSCSCRRQWQQRTHLAACSALRPDQTRKCRHGVSSLHLRPLDWCIYQNGAVATGLCDSGGPPQGAASDCERCACSSSGSGSETTTLLLFEPLKPVVDAKDLVGEVLCADCGQVRPRWENLAACTSWSWTGLVICHAGWRRT